MRAADGGIVWQVDFYEKYKGRGTEFGYSCSPLVIDDLVILPVGGERASVIALRTADGSLAWKAGAKPASYATAVPIEWRGEPLVVSLLQNSLSCVHRRTGELWWEVPLSAGYDEHAAAPLYREPHLLIASPCKGGATCYELVANESTGRCKPEMKWESNQLSNDVASSVLIGDTIYGFDLREAQSRLNRPSRGTFRALDWATGETLWSANEPGQTQLIAADGKLIGFNDRGEVLLFRESRAGYEGLGKVAVFPGEVCWTSPAISAGRLFLRTQSRAACLSLGKAPQKSQWPPLQASQFAARRSFDPTILIGAERDYPAAKPSSEDFQRWGAFGLAALVVAAGLAGLGDWLLKHDGARDFRRGPMVFFWTLVLLIGVAGSRVMHMWRDEYWFTWPLALWACFQIALVFSLHGGRAPFRSRERFASYGVGLLFLVVCAGYFHLLRWLGLALEWCFLTGFVLSFPVAATCEYLVQRPGAYLWPRRLVAYLVSFAAFYWSSALFMEWWLL